ncbi:LpqB family beta-propeller domain-containing protein [Nocardioides terrisoli]|uniref:LpqB family beta-propeller domain-containing protein n=1 Tax=Nocardioides terrisoli TaxID=3388267 RepID=UPI00287B9235|nr:LpqB family beta-propeller domain-containing protein [Nocardioides marmorisolisilvae]
MTTTGRTRRRFLGIAIAVLVCLPTVGCSLLPESGPVQRRATSVDATPQELPYIDPAGPAHGADPQQIVSGFLSAMQANPVSYATARTFLSDQAKQSWKPDGGTIVYDASSLSAAGGRVTARFSDAHELDSRGSWKPGPSRTRTVHFHLVRESGQWRIDDPLSALMVRSGYFDDQFGLYNLYFFDHTGRVLVPEPVYIPRGEQTATSLVRGLLTGPEPRLASVVRSSFPAGASMDFSVAITDNGVAEVPLGNEILKLAPDELNRAMIQLAWTLRSVPGVTRVRITVAGTPVALPDGRTDLSVQDGSEFAPTGLGATRELVAVRGGRVVTVSGGSAKAVSGGLGKGGFALRSVALDRSGDTVAAVSESGTTAYAAMTSSPSSPVEKVFRGGTDLLRPMYDQFGDLWLVDRTAGGAVVHVIRNGVDRVVDLRGVSGQDVSSFSVSPDGSRFAAGLADSQRPRVTVVTVQRRAGGAVLRGVEPEPVPVASYDPSHHLGPVVDVGWRTPTLLAVLTRPDEQSSRVVYAMSDGSPGAGNPVPPDIFPQDAQALVVNSDSGLSLLLLAHGRLARLDAVGKWESGGVAHLTAAAYAN